YNLNLILSFSISIPALIGLVRFSKISNVFYPILYCIWIGLLNEIISYVMIQNGYQNGINNNIYALIESLLIDWNFKNWTVFHFYGYSPGNDFHCHHYNCYSAGNNYHIFCCDTYPSPPAKYCFIQIKNSC